jgi:aubergine-like protein
LSESCGGAGAVFANAIKEVIQRNEPQMIVCIVPSANKDIYDSIKRICCVEFGIPSQVVTSNILNMNNQTKTKSVVTKVAIQINCKLGGEIWGVHLPVNTIFLVQTKF